MRIAQIVLPEASSYERKCQGLDQGILASRNDVLVTTFEGALEQRADIVHVYAPEGFTPPAHNYPLPYIASAAPRANRFVGRKGAAPRIIVSPLENLPEAVGEEYFRDTRSARAGTPALHSIGTFGRHRAGILTMIELTLARIHRFRDDIEWLLFDDPPSPADLALVEVWVDPATSENDYDGYTAEALVALLPVVASRTALNLRRLDKGASGFLVPPHDPNELTHAILTALFKSEVALKRIEAAQQTAGKFRPRQRLRLLEKLYETVVP